VGFALSWLAVKGRSPERVLDALGWRVTGRQEEFPESPLTSAVLPTGWFSIVMQRADAHDGTLDLGSLSQEAEVVTCVVEEHVMVSAASEWADGKEKWSIRHDAQQGLGHLEISGEPPSGAAEIVADARKAQAAEDAGSAEVDFIFDIPINVAERVTGYRYDRAQVQGVAVSFDVLEQIRRPDQKRGSWLKAVFGRRDD